MIFLLEKGAPEGAAEGLRRTALRLGLTAKVLLGEKGRQAVRVEGPIPHRARVELRSCAHVAEVIEAAPAYPLAARGDDGTRPVAIGSLLVGGPELLLAAGPCAVETEEQVQAAAEAAAHAGAKILRGGVFKPRTRPSDFQGLGAPALRWMREAADRHGLLVVTEALDAESCAEVAEWADLIQIGARTMQATALLKVAAKAGRPVLLKRGFASTVDEWLSAAEYLLDGGAPGVLLCERGSRTFEKATRFSLDVGAIAAARLRTHLPILADPSHAAGRRDLVMPLARAALAAGADGLLVEAHPDPACARCDGSQALLLDDLASLAADMRSVGQAVGRTFSGAEPTRAAAGALRHA